MLGRLTMTKLSGGDTEDPVKGVDQAKDQAEQSEKGETKSILGPAPKVEKAIEKRGPCGLPSQSSLPWWC